MTRKGIQERTLLIGKEIQIEVSFLSLDILRAPQIMGFEILLVHLETSHEKLVKWSVIKYSHNS